MTAIENITAPPTLADKPGWLCWRLEQMADEKKPRKVPYYANGEKRYGKQGTERDRAQLVTFDEAVAAVRRLGASGVGLALLPGLGVTALDFDHCVKDGVVDQEVEDMLIGTYAELSPSGTGVRAFVLGDFGNRKSHATPDQFGFETFSTKGFVTFTGRVTEMTAMTGSENVIAMPSAALQTLYASRFASAPGGYDGSPIAPLGLTREQIDAGLAALDANMGHDDWLHVGMALHHETEGDGFDLWDTWSSQGADTSWISSTMTNWPACSPRLPGY